MSNGLLIGLPTGYHMGCQTGCHERGKNANRAIIKGNWRRSITSNKRESPTCKVEVVVRLASYFNRPLKNRISCVKSDKNIIPSLLLNELPGHPTGYQNGLSNGLSNEQVRDANQAVINVNWRRRMTSDRLGSQHAM